MDNRWQWPCQIPINEVLLRISPGIRQGRFGILSLLHQKCKPHHFFHIDHKVLAGIRAWVIQHQYFARPAPSIRRQLGYCCMIYSTDSRSLKFTTCTFFFVLSGIPADRGIKGYSFLDPSFACLLKRGQYLSRYFIVPTIISTHHDDDMIPASISPAKPYGMCSCFTSRYS